MIFNWILHIKTLNFADVEWLKYCRYDVKYLPINKKIPIDKC